MEMKNKINFLKTYFSTWQYKLNVQNRFMGGEINATKEFLQFQRVNGGWKSTSNGDGQRGY